MRNLKKFLALVLALMMVFSLMVTAHAADTSIDPFDRFTDANDVNSTYKDAARVLTNIGVFHGTGTTGTTFSPEVKISRAQMAAIIYRVATGDVNDKYVHLYKDADSRFSDTVGHWAEEYINFCDNADIIKGDGAGHFYPDIDIDGYQVAAMLLRTLGYTQPGEFEGKNWQDQVSRYATQAGITRLVGVSLASVPQRQVVAQMTYNAAVMANRVAWTYGLGYVQIDNVFTGKERKLISNISAVSVTNPAPWGDPAGTGSATFSWPDIPVPTTYKVNYPAVYDSWVAQPECDVYDAIEKYVGSSLGSKTLSATTYTNGTIEAYDCLDTDTIRDTNQVDQIGAQGRNTRIYKVGTNAYDVIYVDTFLAQVTGTIDEVLDGKDHVYIPNSVVLTIYNSNTTCTSCDLTAGNITNVYVENAGNWKTGDLLMLNAITGDWLAYLNGSSATNPLDIDDEDGPIVAMSKIEPQTVEIKTIGVASSNTGATVNGIPYNHTFAYNMVDGTPTNAALTYNSVGKTVNLYTDVKGNILGVTPVETNFGVITAATSTSAGLDGWYNEYRLTLPDGTSKDIKEVQADGRFFPTVGTPSDLYTLVRFDSNPNAKGYYILTEATMDDSTFAYSAGTAPIQAGNINTLSGYTGGTSLKVNNNTVFFVAQYSYKENISKYSFSKYEVKHGFTDINDLNLSAATVAFINGDKTALEVGAFDVNGDGYADFVAVNYANKQSTPATQAVAEYAYVLTNNYVADVTDEYWTYKTVVNGKLTDLNVHRAGGAYTPTVSGLYRYQKFTNNVYELIDSAPINKVTYVNATNWQYSAGVLSNANGGLNKLSGQLAGASFTADNETELTVDRNAQVFLVNPTTGNITQLSLGLLEQSSASPYTKYDLYYQFNSYGWINYIYVIDKGTAPGGVTTALTIGSTISVYSTVGNTVNLINATVSSTGTPNLNGNTFTASAVIEVYNLTYSQWVNYSTATATIGGGVVGSDSITALTSKLPFVSGQLYRATITVKSGTYTKTAVVAFVAD